MACPICNKFYCDHTPEERGQNQQEMMADSYYGVYTRQAISKEEREDKAKKCLEDYGEDGLKTAISLVGEEKAKEIFDSEKITSE